MKDRLSRLISAKAENIITAGKANLRVFSETRNFPLIISPKDSGLILKEWVKDNRETFHAKLNHHGAILFRGFGIDTVESFQDFINSFESSSLEYRNRSSPRYEVARNIYHSTTYPPDQSINMHSENSYALESVRRIVFCCILPADEQGETPVADNRLVLKYLSPETKQKFYDKGVRYVRNIAKGIGLPWEEVFQTRDKREVEKECAGQGMDFTWKDDDRLVLSWKNKAICNHPDTGDEVWFNHAFFFNKYALNEEVRSFFGSDDDLAFNTYFGDGSGISKSEIEEIRSAYENSTVVFPWQKGDVLFLDNMMISHARHPYKGDRKVLVSMF
jgi:alpha-ketoglutarate-dependent taurine dioxygenase